MKEFSTYPLTPCVTPVRTSLCLALVLAVMCAGVILARRDVVAQGLSPQSTPSPPIAQTDSPSDVVREFYKLMHEKKFREAFALSIYQPSIEGLSPVEFDDLRPDFERLASFIPEKINISGEQISGDIATVFLRVKAEDRKDQDEPVTLIRVDGKWIVGDLENQEIVRKAGKEFFFNARIATHHAEVQEMLQRISVAQLVYSKQHAGKFADLRALILAGLVPKDLEGSETTGYRFRVTVAPDGKSWRANAEPAQYGRSGRLSFYLDHSGVRSSDVAGKPLPAPSSKN